MIIEHIAMYVSDLEKTRSFYETYFGAKSNDMYHNTKSDFKSVFLSFETGCRLEIMNIPNLDASQKNSKRCGFVHLAFSVGSKEEVIALTEKIRSAGLEITSEPRTTGDGYFESCVRDTEGNLIEITV